MKAFFVVSALVSVMMSVNVAQANETINCARIDQPNNRLQIVLTEQSTIAGAALYNVDENQTAEANFVAILAAGSVNPMAGIEVILKDHTLLDIEYAVFDRGHNGIVIVNETEEYRCF